MLHHVPIVTPHPAIAVKSTSPNGARRMPRGGGMASVWRTGRDMDELARHLAPRYRVICPDTLGRGLSQWATRPIRECCLAFYAPGGRPDV